jgi:hypothetical protein
VISVLRPVYSPLKQVEYTFSLLMLGSGHEIMGIVTHDSQGVWSFRDAIRDQVDLSVSPRAQQSSVCEREYIMTRRNPPGLTERVDRKFL